MAPKTERAYLARPNQRLPQRCARRFLMAEAVENRRALPACFTIGFFLSEYLLILCYRRCYISATRLLLHHDLNGQQHKIQATREITLYKNP
jgi:hypothetical protein